MKALLDCCCGLDVHKDIIEACILMGEEEGRKITREEFGTIRSELSRLCAWLHQNGCLHIAMESTGVYWQPIYDCIEEEYPEKESLLVVNAHHMHNLPGRKSDIKDAEWIAQLLQHGLLTNSYIPEKRIRSLREMSRLKRSYVNDHTSYYNRLEKFLQRHGFKLSSVVSDILGVSGRRILDLLAQKGTLSLSDVQGAMRKNMKHTPSEIHAAIDGKLDPLECPLLKQILDWLDQLDAQIKKLTDLMLIAAQPDEAQIEIFCSIPGIDVNAGLAILAEIGPAPQQSFANSGRLCSWAGLVPRNDESAGKIKSRRILNGNPYLKSLLVQTAWAAVRNRKSSFSRWFWSHQGILGRKKAIIAVARKMLALIYTLLQSGEFYDSKRGLLVPVSDNR